MLALGAADAHRVLVPAARHAFPGWLHGPLPSLDAGLSSSDVGALLVTMVLGYGVALAYAARAPGRWPLAVAVGAIAICGLAPPLLSADVFGYVAWGQLGAHGVNPYDHASIAVGHAAVRPFLFWPAACRSGGTSLPAACCSWRSARCSSACDATATG